MQRLTHIFEYLATLRLGKSLFMFLMLPTFLVLCAGQASGKEHVLTDAMGETVTGGDFTPRLLPGDTVIISASRTTAIKLYNITGDPDAWITFTNPSDAKITLSDSGSNSTPMLIEGCQYIHLLGNNYGSEAYGIRLTESSGAALRVVNTRDLEVAYLELDTSGGGILMSQCWSPWTCTAETEMENVTIHHNYIHDVGGEGMYLGKSLTGDAPKFKDIQVYSNIVSNTGWDGIQLLQTTGTNNNIYNNILTDCGTAFEVGHVYGILLDAGINEIEIYNNSTSRTGASGIHVADGLIVYVHDNVVWDSNERYPTQDRTGHGIYIYTSEPTTSKVINNTVVSTANGYGIRTSSLSGGSGELRYNLLVANSSGGISSNYSTVNDNRIKSSISGEYFVDPNAGNFKLTENSPAKDAGQGSGYSTIDHNGATRPLSTTAPDIGAYEFGYQGVGPNPPTGLLRVIDG